MHLLLKLFSLKVEIIQQDALNAFKIYRIVKKGEFPTQHYKTFLQLFYLQQFLSLEINILMVLAKYERMRGHLVPTVFFQNVICYLIILLYPKEKLQSDWYPRPPKIEIGGSVRIWATISSIFDVTTKTAEASSFSPRPSSKSRQPDPLFTFPFLKMQIQSPCPNTHFEFRDACHLELEYYQHQNPLNIFNKAVLRERNNF